MNENNIRKRNENSIRISHLSQYYGKKQALADINLEIQRGMFGLLGRNGAGKTTLMKTLATLLPVREGEVGVCGIPSDKKKDIRRIIGYLPQDFAMYPSMTVSEIMDYLGILSGMSGELRKKQSDWLLEQVNLSEYKKVKFKALSGGMKRRLGIAQALLHQPQVLIVDEPTAGLDPEERIRFRNLLCEVAQERIVLLSTHIVGDIEATCENIAILSEGRILYRGTVHKLLEEAEGKVYTITADMKELPLLKKQYVLTGMHTMGGKIQIRLLSETPVADSMRCEPNMEDAYLFHLYKSGVQVDALGGDL